MHNGSLKPEAIKQILQHIQCHSNVHALQYLNYMNALLYHEHYGCNALQCYCSRRLAPTMFHILLVIAISEQSTTGIKVLLF